MTDLITVDRHGATAIVTLNRPEAMNALSAPLKSQLAQTIDALEADDDIRVVILTGAGEKAFTAGLDLKELGGNADDPENADKLLAQLAVGLANFATNNAILTGGAAVVVLNPEHADIFSQANMSRDDVQNKLWQFTHKPVSQYVSPLP